MIHGNSNIMVPTNERTVSGVFSTNGSGALYLVPEVGVAPAHYGGGGTRDGQTDGRGGERQTGELHSGIEESGPGQSDQP